MSSNVDISVILTTYNQDLEDALASIRSVILQEGLSFELIIADDGSEVDHTDAITKYLEDQGFNNYAFAPRQENLGTVGNIERALHLARGRYVKTLGCGDLLYDSRTLVDFRDYADENDALICFGGIKRFTIEDGRVEIDPFNAPFNKDQYVRGANAHKLFIHQITQADWVPAGTQFWNRGFYRDCIFVLYHEFGVRYCEDFAETVALMFGALPLHFDRDIEWYEWGVGISTSGSKSSVERMYKDHLSLFGTIYDQNRDDKDVRRAFEIFLAKRFIALETPFYSFFQNILSKQYVSGGCDGETNSASANEFLLHCLGIRS